jgi:hypothetical protein
MRDDLMIEEPRADVPLRISVCMHREICSHTGKDLPFYVQEQ